MKNKKKDLFDEIAEITANLHGELFIYGPTYKRRKNNFNSLKKGINERVLKPLNKLRLKLLKEKLLKEKKLH